MLHGVSEAELYSADLRAAVGSQFIFRSRSHLTCPTSSRRCRE